MHARSPLSPRELLHELISIGASLRAFNERYAGGRDSGFLLSELIHQNTPQEALALSRPLHSAEESDYLSDANALAKQHAGILRQMGLELRVDDGIAQAKEILADYEIHHGILGSNLEAITVHVAELAIHDFGQFISFLDRLRDPKPRNSPLHGALEIFSSIGDTLTAALERFDFRKKLHYLDHEAPTTIECTQQIVDLLYDLHCETVGDHLSEIVHHAARGDLSDYLRAKHYNLLPYSIAGPDSWHHQLPADLFKERWQVALIVSRDLTVDGETDLSVRVQQHLSRVARDAYLEIKRELSTARPSVHFKQYGPEMLEVLTKALETIPTW